MADLGSTRAILLAAGAGLRFGGGKLLAPRDGRPLLAWAAAALRDAGIPRIAAVVPPGDPKLHELATSLGLEPVVNPDPSRGMGSSLAAGAAFWAARGGIGEDGALLLALGDMPALLPVTVRAVVAACAPPLGIARPAHGGRRGHPVAFGAGHLPALAALGGDAGARSILAAHPELVVDVPADDPGILFDIDTREDLSR